MSKELKSTLLDRDKLPVLCPTHRHAPEFWELLGRTVATFGFLEEVLGRAIFALTATRQYADDKIEAAYQEWLPLLEKALTDQLWNLADSFGAAAKKNQSATSQNVPALVDALKTATVFRNVLCHGSWGAPDANGASVPFFVNKKKEIFPDAIDLTYLQKIQTEAAQLAYDVIDTVTHAGWKFPGTVGPGKSIMER